MQHGQQPGEATQHHHQPAEHRVGVEQASMLLDARIQTREAEQNARRRKRGQVTADDAAGKNPIEIIEVDVGPD